MSTITTIEVPVRISAEAAGHIDGLGLRPMMEQMIDHLQQVVPALHHVDVSYSHFPEAPWDGEKIVVAGWHGAVLDTQASVALQQAIDRWVIDHFPTAIWMHFITSIRSGEADGR